MVRKGKTVEADGKYETVDGTKWFFVTYKNKYGYISEVGLKRV